MCPGLNLTFKSELKSPYSLKTSGLFLQILTSFFFDFRSIQGSGSSNPPLESGEYNGRMGRGARGGGGQRGYRGGPRGRGGNNSGNYNRQDREGSESSTRGSSSRGGRGRGGSSGKGFARGQRFTQNIQIK